MSLRQGEGIGMADKREAATVPFKGIYPESRAPRLSNKGGRNPLVC
jgi:hypothetical protein